MEEKYKLLSVVLKELQEKGVLDGLVVVGRWCCESACNNDPLF